MPKRQRTCPVDGTTLEAFDRRRVYCSDACRKQAKRKPQPKIPEIPPSTAVEDALRVELDMLAVTGTYEGNIALGIARQLDSGAAVGTAYVSLSKELDRKVDALRLKVERPDNPLALIGAAVAEKRSHLRAV